MNEKIDYTADKMPNPSVFVGEVYMMLHSIFDAAGVKAQSNDKFMEAEKVLRDYVWKRCKRALEYKD